MNERIKQLVEAWDNGVRTTAETLISEIRTAIEQAEKREPVATVVSENKPVTMSWWHEPALPVGTKLYTTPPNVATPLAAPVQEGQHALEQALTRLQKRYSELEAKVAAQREWQGLTDEEIEECASYGYRYDVVAVTEAKLKEKNT